MGWGQFNFIKPACSRQRWGYYRAMFNPAQGRSASYATRQLMVRLIGVPALALCGSDDLRSDILEWLDRGDGDGVDALRFLAG